MASAEAEEVPRQAGGGGLWNWNTRLAMLLCLVSGVADSIWIDTVLSSFLYGLARAMNKKDEENTLVGWGEASWGVSQLVFALPIGFLADKWSKAKTIRLGSVLMFAAIVVTAWAVQIGAEAEHGDDDYDSQKAKTSYTVLLLSMVVWGVCGGITNGPAQALFADALPENLRTEGYTYLFGAYLVASSTGPLITIFMFSRLSDKFEDWDLKEIRPVFFLGLVLEILVVVIMLFFRDVKPMDDYQEIEGTGEGEGDKPPAAAHHYNRKVPIILFLSSLVTALGSGASVKFFPLFFKDAGLKPQEVQWIFVFSPLCIAAFTFVAKSVASKLGRIRATLLLESMGASLLMLMSVLHHHGVSNPWIMIPIYLLRTSLMNCTYALIESVLMSAVPSNERSRWKSLESIAAFSWTGSAVLGGVLSDARGYAFAFGITSVVQMIGTWIILPLDSLVPRFEKSEEEPETEASSAATSQEQEDAEARAELSEPLLTSVSESNEGSH